MDRPYSPAEECPASEAELARLRAQIENLQAALDTRDLIGMAKGVIMARDNCTPKQAFDVLSRASQRQNVKVAEIAQQIVSRFS